MKKVLFIVTSAKKIGKEPTGVWLEELATPYYLLTEKGHQVDIASPLGKKTPFDPASLLPENITEPAKRFQEDKLAINKAEHTKILSHLDLNEYDAVFFPGGHGAMVDLPNDEFLKNNLGAFFETGKIVAAVCHGPAALVAGIKADGQNIVSGRKFSCFTDAEEVAVAGDKKVPFMLESKLRELGGNFEGVENFKEFAIRDGNLITGQNPASSKRCAELVLEALN